VANKAAQDTCYLYDAAAAAVAAAAVAAAAAAAAAAAVARNICNQKSQ